MAIIQTSTLSNSVRTQYESAYVRGAMLKKIYDQYASPVGADMSNLAKGSSVSVPFISKLAISTQTISQTADIVPSLMRDATATVTPTSRANAVQIPEILDLTVYTDANAKFMEAIGENMEASIDFLARAAALGGSKVKRYVARASLDAGTAAHRIGLASFQDAALYLQAMRVPQFQADQRSGWMATFHPWLLKDLAADTTLLAIGEYVDPSFLLNGEIGSLQGWRLICPPDAHIFLAAGAANTTNIATTLNGAVNALAKTVTVASGTSIAAGMRLLIGTKETSTTLYPTNEWVEVLSVATNDLTIMGMGENGGLMYDHASGETVSNSDNVYPAVFGGPESLAKVFQPSVGEYGTVVGPKVDGLADQFKTIAWKYYGGYGIVSENRIYRGEYSSAWDA